MPGVTRGLASPTAPRAPRTRWRAEIDDYPVDACWSPDGAFAAVACAEGAVLVFDGVTGAVRHRLAGHAVGALVVAWSPPQGDHAAGERPHGMLASAGQDGYARLWNPTTGACVAELDAAGVERAPRRTVPWVEHLAWSPDGMRVATAAGREVRLWDVAGRLVRSHPTFASTVSALAWRPRPGDPAGARLSASGYGGVALYTPEAGYAEARGVAVLDGQGRAVVERQFDWAGSFLTMKWSPDGRVLAAGMQESAIHLWVAMTAQAVARRTAAGKNPVPAPNISGLPADETEAGFDNLEMSGYPTKVRELAWSADGRLLATGGGTHVTVWSFAGKGPAGTRPLQLGGTSGGHVLPISDVAFHRMSNLLASGGEDGQVLVWDPVNSRPKPLSVALLPGGVSRVAWHPRERIVLSAHASGVISAWAVSR